MKLKVACLYTPHDIIDLVTNLSSETFTVPAAVFSFVLHGVEAHGTIRISDVHIKPLLCNILISCNYKKYGWASCKRHNE